MRAAEGIARELARCGVRHVFGIPGKESLGLGVELERHGIPFVAARHETQAVMMADGEWRASGRLGVALVAQGAGLANTVGGLACVARARSGVVVISGDLLRSDVGDEPRARAIQRLKGVDPRTLCAAVDVDYVRPASADVLLAEVRAALERAAAGRPVSLNVPSDLFSANVEGLPEAARTPRQVPAAPPPDPRAIEETCELLTFLTAGIRPVVLAGRGAVRAGAVPALRRLAERIGAVLATTLLARSAFAGDAFDAGVCGTFASPVASELFARADCVIAVGASLNPFTTYGGSIFPRRAPLIQVDADASALGRYVDPAIGVRADARAFADALLAELERRSYSSRGFRTPEVAARIAGYDARTSFTDASADGYIDPRTLMLELDRILPRGRAVVIDAGLHLHYAATFLGVERPEDFIFPIDSLAVGLGMGAAIGAAVARPERTTVLEVGDGGLMMSLGDLETAVRLRLPLVVVVSNDQAWGAEAQHLEALGLPDAFVHVPTPSLAEVARALGADGHTVASAADVRALAPLLAAPPERPVLLDCRVHPGIRPASFDFDYAGVFAK
ncbi:MAG: thiamine pyrophosphate-binding protein [Chloroflexota bacterium]|nr:thiamine pyrophosphate-binding protein [Chloroflexota bacterium]